MFDNVFDNVFENALGFGVPTSFFFNTGDTKDMYPVNWKKLKKIDGDNSGITCYRATLRTVGVNPNDLRFETAKDNIIVKGETKTKGITYNCSYELPVSEELMSDINNIKFESINGITYIYIYVKEKEKRQIKIEKM